MTVALFEDFIEKEDMLFAEQSGSGQHVRIDGAGGLVQLETGTTSLNWYQLRTNQKMFNSVLSPIVTVALRPVDSTNIEVFAGLASDHLGSATDAIGFFKYGTANTEWQTWTRKGGSGGVGPATGVLADTEFVNFSIAVSPLEIVYALDGRVVHVVTDNTKIPIASMYLLVWIKTTTAAKRSLVVDFVGVASGR